MILEIISAAFDGVILWIYLQNMLGKENTRVPSPLYISLIILTEMIHTGFSVIFSGVYTSTKLFIIVGVSLLITCLLTFLHDCPMRHRVFTALSYQVYATVSETIVYLLFSLMPLEISKNLLNNNSYGSIASKIVLFLLLNLTILFRRRKERHYTVSYTLLLLIMPTLSLLLLMTIPSHSSLDDVQAVVSLVGMAGILVANAANYFLLDNVLRVGELTRQTRQLNRQISYQADKYQQISTTYKKTRRLIHDTKKHFFIIRSCIEKQSYDEILSYLDQSIKHMEESYNRINTGNLVIDAFVSNHLAVAEQENIQFRTDIRIEKDSIRIDDYDLCILLGNLLDNALNACRQVPVPFPRQITVEIFMTELEFVIHIFNTFHEETATSTRQLSFDLEHGFGMQNVENTVLKYYGNYTHFTENNYYHAIVSIPIL